MSPRRRASGFAKAICHRFGGERERDHQGRQRRRVADRDEYRLTSDRGRDRDRVVDRVAAGEVGERRGGREGGGGDRRRDPGHLRGVVATPDADVGPGARHPGGERERPVRKLLVGGEAQLEQPLRARVQAEQRGDVAHVREGLAPEDRDRRRDRESDQRTPEVTRGDEREHDVEADLQGQRPERQVDPEAGDEAAVEHRRDLVLAGEVDQDLPESGEGRIRRGDERHRDEQDHQREPEGGQQPGGASDRV